MVVMWKGPAMRGPVLRAGCPAGIWMTTPYLILCWIRCCERPGNVLENPSIDRIRVKMQVGQADGQEV